MPTEHSRIRAAIALIDSLGDEVTCASGSEEEDITAIERGFDIQFPDSYRRFLRRCGALSAGPVKICGLGPPWDSALSLVQALVMLRATDSRFPWTLIPVEELDDGRFACLQSQEDQSHGTEVVAWDPFSNSDRPKPQHMSADFGTYLYERLNEWRSRDEGLRRMEWHTERFEEEYLSVGKLPRNHVWRPYRFCVQDVVIGLVVVRHSLKNNCLEVDVCLTSDASEYEPHSGAKMTAAFLFSEAYKCGGTMEIRFSRNVEGGNVPASLSRLAQSLEVNLNHVTEGRITPSEARRLYVAITGFSPTLRNQLEDLSRAGKLSLERVCYVVHNGIWTLPEVESIVFGSDRPDSVFAGAALPEQRHLHKQDILHARAAILGAFLDRKLARRERMEGDAAIELEDDTRRLNIVFDSVFYAKLYRCDEDMPIPWLRNRRQAPRIVSKGERLVALVRPREASGLSLHLEQDLEAAHAMVRSLEKDSPRAHVFVLTPSDFEELPRRRQERLLAEAQAHGIGIMVCPETTGSLDTEATRRLATSRIVRQ